MAAYDECDFEKHWQSKLRILHKLVSISKSQRQNLWTSCRETIQLKDTKKISEKENKDSLWKRLIRVFLRHVHHTCFPGGISVYFFACAPLFFNFSSRPSASKVQIAANSANAANSEGTSPRPLTWLPWARPADLWECFKYQYVSTELNFWQWHYFLDHPWEARVARRCFFFAPSAQRSVQDKRYYHLLEYAATNFLYQK